MKTTTKTTDRFINLRYLLHPLNDCAQNPLKALPNGTLVLAGGITYKIAPNGVRNMDLGVFNKYSDGVNIYTQGLVLVDLDSYVESWANFCGFCIRKKKTFYNEILVQHRTNCLSSMNVLRTILALTDPDRQAYIYDKYSFL